MSYKCIECKKNLFENIENITLFTPNQLFHLI